MKLDQRIAALEQAGAPSRISCILRRIIDPGRQAGELQQLRDHGGRTWVRVAGETEAALIDRAAGELRAANPKAIPRLIGETAAA